MKFIQVKTPQQSVLPKAARQEAVLKHNTYSNRIFELSTVKSTDSVISSKIYSDLHHASCMIKRCRYVNPEP